MHNASFLSPKNEIAIEPYCRGYMVRFPNGDFCWQPSKDFADAAVRQYRHKHSDTDTPLQKVK